MPDQSEAATEHALIQEITAPLSSLPDDPMTIVADTDFPIVLRGYDRLAVDAYVKRTSQLVAELQATRSPEAAMRRALERVGEQISGILQRAHETSQQITSQSRREAEDRLEAARREAHQITAAADQLLGLAEEAARRFPPAEEPAPPGSAVPEEVTDDEPTTVMPAPAVGERAVGDPAVGEDPEPEAHA